MKKVVIISGANKGLGEALFNELIKNENYIIVSLSRKLSGQQSELLKTKPKNFTYLFCDFSDKIDTSELKLFISQTSDVNEVIFISNAGTISPIGKVGEFNEKVLLDSIKVNVVTPTLVINVLLSGFQFNKLKIVNISSGAANHPIDGWSLYCASKSYMKMLIDTIELERGNDVNIEVFNVDPGVMDTDMQSEIRSTANFARHSDFVELKDLNKLKTPQSVASKIISDLSI